MAVNYTNLFTDIGAFIKALNAFRAFSTASGTIETQLANIITKLSSTGREDILSGVQELYDGMKDSGISWATSNVSKINERIQHRATVLEELSGLGMGSDVLTILIELSRDMVVNSQDINASVVTVGAVTTDAGNTGNAVLLVDKVLDGVNSPINGGPYNPEWNGIDSQLSVSDNFSVTCTADEDTDGLVLGEEQFIIEGNPISRAGPFGWETEGSGVSREVGSLNSHQLIANKDFESWSANVPESWDLDAGTAGTDVIQETTGADVYRGDSALRFTGDGATATFQISQTLPLRLLVPGQRYCLSCFVKGDATVGAGTLTIQFESPSGGYVAASSEKIEMLAAALAAQTSYGEEHFWINAPASIPDDLELVIKTTATLTSAATVQVDSLAFGPVEWFNGVSLAICSGSAQNIRTDRYTFTITNDDAGVFQTFFRKQYKFQMPSQTDASETQADSLAT
jgi:hypothetical protein